MTPADKAAGAIREALKDHADYAKAMRLGDLDRCLEIEKRCELLGYPPDLVTIALLSIDAAALTALLDELERLRRDADSQWICDRLPERFGLSERSVAVLAVVDTGDGCFQITPARVERLSKREWREIRFDHDGPGRKLEVRCWRPMPAFPKRTPDIHPAIKENRA
jgi:hypothetical protein